MDIMLETLLLVSFDKDNIEHIKFLKSIIEDASITNRFSGFLPHLNSNSTTIIDKGFFIKDKDELIGYIDIGTKDINDAVYLRGAITSEKRGCGYGIRMLNETTNYIFANFNDIKKINLKIAKDNIASMNTASKCGYVWESDDYFTKINPNYKALGL